MRREEVREEWRRGRGEGGEEEGEPEKKRGRRGRAVGEERWKKRR